MSTLHASYTVPKEMPLRSPRGLSVSALDGILLSCSAVIGLAQAWFSRYSMDPDGISYLDMGNSLARGDWHHAVNAYWSPLYGWLLGLAVHVVKPTPRWEFPVVHAVNFGIFLLALLAFRFLLGAVVAFNEDRETGNAASLRRGNALPAWALVLLGYGMFLWACLNVVTTYDTSPDMAVLACVCLAVGTLLRLRISPQPGRFALLGMILGVGYWTKAPMLPLGVATLILVLLWNRESSQWRRGIVVAMAAFLCVAAPLVARLSLQKRRLTFGDSAKLNYCWYVSPAIPFRNWHGLPAASGTPLHPTRVLLQQPAVFSFDGPVAGTYPPWADPSYWNEGLRWHFRVVRQTKVLLSNAVGELRLLLREEPVLLAGVLLLALLSGRAWLDAARELWPIFSIALAAFLLYLPVHVEDRFLGGWVLVLFLLAASAARLRAVDQRYGTFVAVVVFALMLVGTADQTVRYATNHLLIPGVGPNSTAEDIAAAEHMSSVGLQAGDKVAFVGIGRSVYAAHLAKLRAVADIMAYDHGYRDFWALTEPEKQNAYTALRFAGVKAILTTCPEKVIGEWRQLGGTSYCTLRLGQNQS